MSETGWEYIWEWEYYVPMSRKVLGVALFLFFSVSGSSQDPAAQAKQDNDETKCCCNTLETGQCLTKAFKKVDGEMNAVYQKALKERVKNDTEDADRLQVAQRAWLKYRDTNCDAEYKLWGGGSGGPNAYVMCKIRMTRARTAEISAAYFEH